MSQVGRARRFLSHGFASLSQRVAPYPTKARSDPAAKRVFCKLPGSCHVQGLPHQLALTIGEWVDGAAVELGALDGVTYSNTSCLVDVGWLLTSSTLPRAA